MWLHWLKPHKLFNILIIKWLKLQLVRWPKLSHTMTGERSPFFLIKHQIIYLPIHWLKIRGLRGLGNLTQEEEAHPSFILTKETMEVLFINLNLHSEKRWQLTPGPRNFKISSNFTGQKIERQSQISNQHNTLSNLQA